MTEPMPTGDAFIERYSTPELAGMKAKDSAPPPTMTVAKPRGHEFDAACGAVWGMRFHPDEYTEADIVRAVVRELFYMSLDLPPWDSSCSRFVAALEKARMYSGDDATSGSQATPHPAGGTA